MEARIYDGRRLIGKLPLKGPEPSHFHKDDICWHGIGSIPGHYLNVYMSKTVIPDRKNDGVIDLCAMQDE